MSQWTVSWNFDRGTYIPGSRGACGFWLENTGNTILYAEKVWLGFDWQTNEAFYKKCERQIPPRKNIFLTSLDFDIPKTRAGTILYSVGVDLHEYNETARVWSKLPTWWSDRNFFLKSIPSPYYKAFVSRGIRPEDRLISDPIVEMIKEWGFDPVTVGIEKTADPDVINETVKNEIKTADCLIAIATRRYVDALTGLWRTLEWFHGETGIGFGLDKPLLILAANDVTVGGLPGYIANTGKKRSLVFNPLDLNSLQPMIDGIMPSFRDWISTKKGQEFWEAIARMCLPLVIGGIFGFALGSSKK